ncbi:MAG: PKD domain-containing protein [Gemmataceae bacterium]|nr:PKD domain-containing protein [Gemmataceae bacterium]
MLTLLLVLAADPWHLAGWECRAVVEVAKASDTPGCDVCGIKVLCQGRAKADGSDFRVTDAAGKPLAFQLVHLDAARYALVSFRCADAKARCHVYFGNPKAAKPAEMVETPEIGAAAPKGAWVPRYGFVLQTRERPRSKDGKDDNPRTVDDLKKLVAGSKAIHGARYQRQVAEGYNLFGPSDHYISAYRGWVRVPKAGKHRFCTVSNEASFSFIGGKELIHWPGRHTAERGARGEVNALHDLAEGLHYVEYWHEEVMGEQMAYLGWRPSADEGPFSPIPASFFTMAHEGAVKAYEAPMGPLAAFEPAISDSVWLAERAEGQFTRVLFQAPAGFPAGTTFAWEFGDGQKATGEKAEHVYLTLGDFAVKLTATSGTEKRTALYPLRVFEIEHVTDRYKEGKPGDYARHAKGYDRAALPAEALKELAWLFAESEQPKEAIGVGKDFVKLHGKEDLRTARVRRLMADCAIRLREGALDDAIKSYKASLVKEAPATEKLQVLARLVRLVGVEREKAKTALGFLDDADAVMKEEKPDAEGKEAYRLAVIAAGDVLLWNGLGDEAMKHYARAEKLRPKAIPPQVRAAKIGAYPNSLREYAEAGNYGAALDLIDQWEQTFPTDKVNGQSIFWRGKVLALRGQPSEASRQLRRCIALASGSGVETEARWLLAEALATTGKPDEAKRELAKLIATGIKDEYTKKAAEKLKK